MPYEFTTPKLAQLRRERTFVVPWSRPALGWHAASGFDIREDSYFVTLRRIRDDAITGASRKVNPDNRSAVAAALRSIRKDIRAHG
jgi:hypothetical protein